MSSADHHRDHDELARLVRLAADATSDLSVRTSALELYRDARDVAEQRIPGPMGTAVAAVLAGAACQRSLQQVGGCLGATRSTMALAIAVLSIVPDEEATPA